jgi:hypothetical protein
MPSFGLTRLFQTTSRAASAVARVKFSDDDPLVLKEVLNLPRLADGNRRLAAKPQHFGKRQARRDDGSERFKTIYKRRSAVEREFGRLKHEYGLAFLRVRGIERVRLHADLTMLGRLSLALARARAVPLAA